MNNRNSLSMPKFLIYASGTLWGTLTKDLPESKYCSEEQILVEGHKIHTICTGRLVVIMLQTFFFQEKRLVV